MSGEAPQSNKKLTDYTNIEVAIRKKWEEAKAFEIDAPEDGAAKADETYFATFPYPYSNGKLHLGHAFSLSKAEFAVGFQRLMGKKCLFPLGFHCTGMPIKAAADKLKNEIAEFGNPPVFPVESATVDDGKKQHAKIEAKTGGAKRQWAIMEQSGVPKEEIVKFTDADHWLTYFPPMGITDAKLLGLKIDWRRSFVTTPVNAYYDSFVRWQFMHLKEKNKIKFGKRYSVYSPKDGQACMDHDRSEGENKGLTDYTGIKLQLCEPLPPSVQGFKDKKIFLVAATLRPETMYGQTNCWVSPKLTYVAFQINDTDVLVTTERAARNISWQMFDQGSGQGVQGNTKGPEGHVNKLGDVPGSELIGCKVNAPYSVYKEVYCLPLMTIKPDMGTGIVTSVPSDAPDDWAGLRDLQKKAPMREKFGLTDEMVIPFAPTPIIEVPDYSSVSAVTACDEFKIASQNDREKLDLAKDKCYNQGFHSGIMLVGTYKGKKVHFAKDKVREELLKENLAFIYKEPEALIVSRSLDVCVGALCDQWYLVYGEPVWRDEVKDYVSGEFESFGAADKFNAALDWLHEHACSRIYGLGSRLPWDESWLIESLSDSTIYMAYYTVCHLLHGGTLDGKGESPLGIKAEEMTRETWDYIFFGTAVSAECTIPLEKLKKMRNEFLYFYPMDLRVSGKDLIPNHLTYSLYNHAAIFPKEHWPRAFRTNGFLHLNHQKMSKSTGNFMTLEEAVVSYTADATRLTLADAGDSVESADFEQESAVANLLRMYKENEWVTEMLKELPSMRAGPITSFLDRCFLNSISKAVHSAKQFYIKHLYREALRSGFFEFQKARDHYRDMTKLQGVGMHRDLVVHFIDMQYLILAPFTPHASEHVWTLLGKEGTMIANARWPELPPVDLSLDAAFDYLVDLVYAVRKKKIDIEKKKGKAALAGPVTKATIYVAAEYPAWMTAILKALEALYDEKANTLPDTKALMPVLREALKDFEQMKDKKFFAKGAMPFVGMVRQTLAVKQRDALRSAMIFDETVTINENLQYIKLSLGLDELEVKHLSETDDKRVNEKCLPGEPFPVFSA